MLFICKLARLSIWVTNCPGRENSQSFLQQKSPVVPDGGSDYWTGKGKKQAKHSCPLFTHICTSFVLVHTHMLTHTQKQKKKHSLETALCIHPAYSAQPSKLPASLALSKTRGLTNTAGSLNWCRDLARELRECSKVVEKVVGFKIINISVRKIVS